MGMSASALISSRGFQPCIEGMEIRTEEMHALSISFRDSLPLAAAGNGGVDFEPQRLMAAQEGG
jgi:hypothetical protein